MKIAVDREKCLNSGMCAQTAPEVFAMDDDGALVIVLENVPDEHLEAVQDAVACCPVSALRLH